MMTDQSLTQDIEMMEHTLESIVGETVIKREDSYVNGRNTGDGMRSPHFKESTNIQI